MECQTCAGQTRYEGDNWTCPDCPCVHPILRGVGPQHCAVCGADVPFRPTHLLYETATVDEFIAWFRANCVSWEAWRFQDVSAWACETDQSHVRPSVTFCRENRYTINFHGETLLEACRKAFVEVNR